MFLTELMLESISYSNVLFLSPCLFEEVPRILTIESTDSTPGGLDMSVRLGGRGGEEVAGRHPMA